MRLVLLCGWIMLICASLEAQTNVFPFPLQSFGSGEDNNACNGTTSTANVTSGNRVAGYASWADTGSGPTTTVVSDSNGVVPSFTMSSGISVSTGGANVLRMQLFDGVATSTGSVKLITTPNISGLNCALAGMELPSTLTLDGSVQSTTYTTTPSSISTNVTTALGGDLILGASTANKGTVGLVGATPPAQFASSTSGQVDGMMSVTNAGAAGATSVTQSTDQNQFWVMGVQAYKPTAQSIVTTALADACSGLGYSQTLSDVGYSSAPSWSVTVGSLPTGITINSSTGVLSASNVSGTTQTFTVSDGTATKSLTIKVDSTCGIPSLRNFVTGSNGSSWTLAGVVSGDTLMLCGQLYESNQGNGYIEPVSTLHGTVGDSTYTLVGPYAGGRMSGIPCYTSKANSSGTDTLTWGKTGNGSPLGSIFMDWANTQPVVSIGASNVIAKSQATLTLTTGNLVTQVANEQLFAIGSVFGTNGSTTLQINSPFTSIATTNGGLVFAEQANAQAPAVTQGTYTATLSASNLPTPGNQADTVVVYGMLPGPPAIQAFAGERRRIRKY